MTIPDLAPTPLEIAVGSMIGEQPVPPASGMATGELSPRDALERALLPALELAPCVIPFSGGRDSSLLLAVGTAVARREGLESPVPISVRFRNAPGTGESEWQELVVRHLGIERWERLEVENELDLVGPLATSILRRHGVIHPPHTTLFALIGDRLPCRSLVTGFGGDQVLGGWVGHRDSDRLPRAALLRRPLLTLHRAAPTTFRRLTLRPDVPDRPWLTPSARQQFARLWIEAAASEPSTWPRYLSWLARRRNLAVVRRSLELVLRDRGVAVFHPLLEHAVLGALAHAGGRRGLGDREALTRLLAQDDLPRSVTARSTKAHFHHAYFRDGSRAFARRWDGSGLPSELIRPEALRRAWLGRWPRGSSALALQAAWLASAGREPDEPFDGIGQQLEAPRTH